MRIITIFKYQTVKIRGLRNKYWMKTARQDEPVLIIFIFYLVYIYIYNFIYLELYPYI